MTSTTARFVKVVVVMASLCSGASLCAQTAEAKPTTQANAPAQISFQFDRPGLPVPHFVLLVREDGTGRYQAEQVARSSSDGSVRGEAAQQIDRTMTLSAHTVSKLFQDARALNDFRVVCASKLKHIANTGDKTLSYTGPDGTGSCAYNYSEDKTVAAVTDTLLAIAFTMDEGRKLEFLHRYDRLGLDAEMNFLSQEVAAGRAVELATIATTLQSIANDTAVMQRVRLAAAKMLQEVTGTH
jgi:hypothetical protein